MGYVSDSVGKLCCLMLVVLCAAASPDAGVARGQSASEALLNPPDWILGEWHNSAESDSRRWEQFTFTPHGIILTEGFPVKKVVVFGRQYRGYRVKETVGARTYRVELYRGKTSFVYEFKLVETDAYTAFMKGGLTYSVTRNNRVVRPYDPSPSSQDVLFRRAAGG
jgi:hypothetical protein